MYSAIRDDLIHLDGLYLAGRDWLCTDIISSIQSASSSLRLLVQLFSTLSSHADSLHKYNAELLITSFCMLWHFPSTAGGRTLPKQNVPRIRCLQDSATTVSCWSARWHHSRNYACMSVSITIAATLQLLSGLLATLKNRNMRCIQSTSAHGKSIHRSTSAYSMLPSTTCLYLPIDQACSVLLVQQSWECTRSSYHSVDTNHQELISNAAIERPKTKYRPREYSRSI